MSMKETKETKEKIERILANLAYVKGMADALLKEFKENPKKEGAYLTVKSEITLDMTTVFIKAVQDYNKEYYRDEL